MASFSEVIGDSASVCLKCIGHGNVPEKGKIQPSMACPRCGGEGIEPLWAIAMRPFVLPIVKEAVDAADLFGLWKMGCPPDEYDSESRSITMLIHPAMGEQSVEWAVKKVFEAAASISSAHKVGDEYLVTPIKGELKPDLDAAWAMDVASDIVKKMRYLR